MNAYTILCQMSGEWGVNGSLIHFPVYGHYIPWPYLLDSGEPGNSTTYYQNIGVASLASISAVGGRAIIPSPNPRPENYRASTNEGPPGHINLSQTYVTNIASPCGTASYTV
ncbi:hypothetical protein N7G274_003853 [Stereocaulon virgatum]|uniref:Uncharacterized protein n=1 Tax=Stereocaulon virgatum TaxID=373712 RepID=A0ABR4AFB7_9LECA